MRLGMTGAIFVFHIAQSTPSAMASELAPGPLRGKSVELSWSSSWTTKAVDTGRMYVDSAQSDNARFYFSTNGRTFSRRSFVPRVGKAFSVDTVGIEASKGPISSFKRFSFAGQTMHAIRTMGGGDAFRVVVTFDATFSSCSATAAHAKGSGVSLYRNPNAGEMRSIISITTSGVSCAIRSGNIFE